MTIAVVSRDPRCAGKSLQARDGWETAACSSARGNRFIPQSLGLEGFSTAPVCARSYQRLLLNYSGWCRPVTARSRHPCHHARIALNVTTYARNPLTRYWGHEQSPAAALRIFPRCDVTAFCLWARQVAQYHGGPWLPQRAGISARPHVSCCCLTPAPLLRRPRHRPLCTSATMPSTCSASAASSSAIGRTRARLRPGPTSSACA